MYTHSKQVIENGVPLEQAEKAIIMLHGRGASAESIISLTPNLNLVNTAVLSPQAAHHSWYPYSFLAPAEDNQPALDSALEVISQITADVKAAGIPLNQLYFLGFSQGACLALEYAARNAAGYGGVIAFTGGLIGETLNTKNYSGDFLHTPVLITTGDPDPHVPLIRVQESAVILEKMNAEVSTHVYKGRIHTIQLEEIQLAGKLISG